MNGLKSLILSPAPINLIGNPTSKETASDTPPLDEPSSLVITAQVKIADIEITIAPMVIVVMLTMEAIVQQIIQ